MIELTPVEVDAILGPQPVGERAIREARTLAVYTEWDRESHRTIQQVMP